MINADGSEARRVSPVGQSRFNPSWSPEGRYLAVDDRQTVYRIDTESGQEIPLTEPEEITLACLGQESTFPVYYHQPSWSPDGGRIALIRWHELAPSPSQGSCDPTPFFAFDLAVIPAGGGVPAMVTEDPPRWGEARFDALPDWSPDGSKIVLQRAETASSSIGIAVVSPGGAVTRLSAFGGRPRWSPDGTKILFTRDEDQDGAREVWTMDAAGGSGLTPVLQDSNNNLYQDWQKRPDYLPIVFVPGMLGSDLVCVNKEVWPGKGAFGTPKPRFALMTLAWDGIRNGRHGGDPDCSSTVAASGRIVNESYGYKDTIKFLDRLPTDVVYYGWDWRKSPLAAVSGLDAKVDDLLERTKADEVVLMAHSMGGLVARAYVDENPAKVDRVVTLGTPYLGAPKIWLALSQGRTDPHFNWLDDIVRDRELSLFARTSPGTFFAYPSERYISLVGRWLSVPDVDDGAPLDAQQVLDRVRSYGGNAALLQEAYTWHEELLEVYPEGDDVDWQMIAGRGVRTLMTFKGTAANPVYTFGDGDGTVPHQSAGMGEAAPSAVHYVCGVEHSKLTGHKKVTSIVKDFLLDGDPIEGEPGPCPAR